VSEYITVGKVKDAHGIKGELYLLIFSGETAWLDQLTEIHLIPPEVSESAQSPRSKGASHDGAGDANSRNAIKPTAEKPPAIVDLKIKSVRPHKGGLIVKTHELRDRNQAEAFIGHLFQIPKDFLKSEPGEALYLGEVHGFSVEIETGLIGAVIGFSSNGAQDLLVVPTDKGEVEIPFVDEFVESIDYENKIIRMKLPEGLLELQLPDQQRESD
jgi:16S rRNA processing protein RimM